MKIINFDSARASRVADRIFNFPIDLVGKVRNAYPGEGRYEYVSHKYQSCLQLELDVEMGNVVPEGLELSHYIRIYQGGYKTKSIANGVAKRKSANLEGRFIRIRGKRYDLKINKEKDYYEMMDPKIDKLD